MRKANKPENNPTHLLPKTRAAWAPAIVAPSVLATVLSVRMALIASSTRSVRISSSRPAPTLPRRFCSTNVTLREDSSAASNREQTNEMPTARPM